MFLYNAFYEQSLDLDGMFLNVWCLIVSRLDTRQIIHVSRVSKLFYQVANHYTTWYHHIAGRFDLGAYKLPEPLVHLLNDRRKNGYVLTTWMEAVSKFDSRVWTRMKLDNHLFHDVIVIYNFNVGGEQSAQLHPVESIYITQINLVSRTIKVKIVLRNDEHVDIDGTVDDLDRLATDISRGGNICEIPQLYLEQYEPPLAMQGDSLRFFMSRWYNVKLVDLFHMYKLIRAENGLVDSPIIHCQKATNQHTDFYDSLEGFIHTYIKNQ